MVAGMLMPLNHLRAIYERLFRDGVMVAKKDKRPQTNHPEIPGVGNLQVIRAMDSLKSRGFVRETFAWRHFYWYLTNEGIVYLRDYLHLPPEIVPTPLQRVRRPAATLAVVQRATRVQAVEGPTSYVPKPGRGGAEMQEALSERQGYRRKQMGTEEGARSNENYSRFLGRSIAGDKMKTSTSWESREQVQPMPHRGQNEREVDRRVRKKTTTDALSHQPPAEISSAQSLMQKKMICEDSKAGTEAALSKSTPKATGSRDLPAHLSITSITPCAVAAATSVSPNKAEKVKLKEKVSSVNVYQETASSMPGKDASMPPLTEKQMEKKNKSQRDQESSGTSY
ncbi:plectin-like [Electrophorus electricus]|uniref:plectin-like n=1 Tax=Electrophorus electricus TaxID=8005 RepID=UPI0015CF94E0|nr:plectin-like [Electrophorus electricus]